MCLEVAADVGGVPSGACGQPATSCWKRLHIEAPHKSLVRSGELGNDGPNNLGTYFHPRLERKMFAKCRRAAPHQGVQMKSLRLPCLPEEF